MTLTEQDSHQAPSVDGVAAPEVHGEDHGVENLPAFRMLIGMLEDREGLRSLLSLPDRALSSHLTEDQQQAWLVLIQHFSREAMPTGLGNDSSEDTDEGGEGTRPVKKPKPKRPKRDPWAPFTKLTSLKLPDEYARHLRKAGFEPSRFLTDDGILKNEVAGCQEGAVGDAFMACYRYTLHLQTRRIKDRVRWFFSMLLYYDLAKLLRPNGKGLFGPRMQEEIRQLFGPALLGSVVPEDAAIEQLRSWSVQGRKLEMFCHSFGTGSLFFLEGLLSEDFLANKCSGSGDYHDKAFAHLNQMGLKRAAEDEGATKLGDAVRSYLIRPFRQTYASQRLETTKKRKRDT